MIKQQFFGHPESPLFAVSHSPRGNASPGPVRAAIICPPIGQEYNRTHWTLRLLANQVARKGVHVLRLDYHGIGDSAQSVDQIANLNCWQRNVEQAIDHTKKQTGAATVMLIGVRFGGLLAAQVAAKRPDVNGIVLWEPVLNGKAYIDSLRKMHATMLDFWVCKMKTPNDNQLEEILGSQYQRRLLNEIEAAEFDLRDVIQPQLIADLAEKANSYSHPIDGNQFVIKDSRPETWCEMNDLESAWLRPRTLREIAKKIDDMFGRLQSHGALTTPFDLPQTTGVNQ